MHVDTKKLLTLLVIWAALAGASWAAWANFHPIYESLFHHEAAAGAPAPTQAELEAHEVHVNLWGTVVLFLAIFMSVGTLLALVMSLFTVLRYERERGSGDAHAHGHHA